MIEVIINGELCQIAPGQKLDGLIEAMGHAGKRIAVERNGEIVPRSFHSATIVDAGDRLELVVAVGGG